MSKDILYNEEKDDEPLVGTLTDQAEETSTTPASSTELLISPTIVGKYLSIEPNGDVTIGDYAGGQGIFWDQSAGTFLIEGNITTQNLTINGPGQSALVIKDTDYTNLNITVHSSAAADVSGRVMLKRARGTEAVPVVTSNGDYIGRIIFMGHDGNLSFITSSEIRGEIDGACGANDMPGRLIFLTTPDGDKDLYERARIDNKGNVIINTAAIATTATDGFLYIPSTAGAPTGVPTAYAGRIPIVYDTTNNKLYAYNGAWRSTQFA